MIRIRWVSSGSRKKHCNHSRGRISIQYTRTVNASASHIRMHSLGARLGEIVFSFVIFPIFSIFWILRCGLMSIANNTYRKYSMCNKMIFFSSIFAQLPLLLHFSCQWQLKPITTKYSNICILLVSWTWNGKPKDSCIERRVLKTICTEKCSLYL